MSTELSNIALLRLLKGYNVLTAVECANICGVKIGMWYRWERGEYVTPKYLEATANVITPEQRDEIFAALESGLTQDDYIHLHNILVKKVGNHNS